MMALTPHYVIVVIDMKSVVPMLSPPPPPPLLAHNVNASIIALSSSSLSFLCNFFSSP